MNLDSTISREREKPVRYKGIARLRAVNGGDELRAEVLRSASLFANLSEEKRAVLAAELRPASFAKGARIFHEGCDPDSFFLITEGWVKISRDTASGRSVVFELRGPGQTVGTVALTDGRPFSASGIAATKLEMLVMPGKRFLQLLERDSELQHAYLRDLNVRLREARDSHAQITLPIQSRIALLFTTLAKRMGETDELGEIHIPRILTRQDIADMVGTTVETVIRTLSKWKQQALMVTKPSDMVIEDYEELSMLAEAC